jgi:hypothetical protein
VKAEPSKYFSKNRRRKIVTALLNLEGAVVLALGAFLIFKALNADTVELLPLSGEIFFIAIGGFGLLAAAYAFKSMRNFGRAPAVLANLIALGVAKFQFEGGLWFLALPLVVVAAIILYCAVTILPTTGDQ